MLHIIFLISSILHYIRIILDIYKITTILYVLLFFLRDIKVSKEDSNKTPRASHKTRAQCVAEQFEVVKKRRRIEWRGPGLYAGT